MKNPWKIVKSEVVYENSWIQVEHHDVLTPSSQKGIYGKVHFKNTAIGIIPLDAEYNTWIVGQYRFPLQAYSWEIPEGGGSVDSTTLESAQRELLEETGIQATVWKEVLQMHLSNSVSDEYGLVYVAKELSFQAPEPEDCEALETRKVPFSTLHEMVIKGEITDSLSVAGVLKVGYMLAHDLI